MRSCSYHAKFSKFKHLAGKSRMSTVTTCLDNVYFIPSFSTTAWVKWVTLEVAFARPASWRRSRRLPRPGRVASRPSTTQRNPHGETKRKLRRALQQPEVSPVSYGRQVILQVITITHPHHIHTLRNIKCKQRGVSASRHQKSALAADKKIPKNPIVHQKNFLCFDTAAISTYFNSQSWHIIDHGKDLPLIECLCTTTDIHQQPLCEATSSHGQSLRPSWPNSHCGDRNCRRAWHHCLEMLLSVGFQAQKDKSNEKSHENKNKSNTRI